MNTTFRAACEDEILRRAQCKSRTRLEMYLLVFECWCSSVDFLVILRTHLSIILFCPKQHSVPSAVIQYVSARDTPRPHTTSTKSVRAKRAVHPPAKPTISSFATFPWASKYLCSSVDFRFKKRVRTLTLLRTKTRHFLSHHTSQSIFRFHQNTETRLATPNELSPQL